MPSRTHYVTHKGKPLTHIKELGRGQFGIARAVKSCKGSLYCLKEIEVRTTDEKAKAMAKQEVEMMRLSGTHPNVISFFDSWFEANRLFILMEYAPAARSTS